MNFIDIILPLSLPKLFTYSVPENLILELQVGKRAVVQFGKKKLYTGIIFKIHQQKPTEYETKEILEIIDDKPIVNQKQFQFWQWIADYYMCSLGEVYKAALPSGFKLESETQLFLNPEFDDLNSLSAKEELIFIALQNKPTFTINDANLLLELKNSIATIKSLHDKNAIFLEEKLRENYKAKYETYVKLHESVVTDEDLKQAFEKLKRSPKQQDILMSYLTISEFYTSKKIKNVAKKDLLVSAQSDASTFNSLIKKEILTTFEIEIGRLDFETIETNDFKDLSEAQKLAFTQVNSEFETKDVVLLHGITSSGKTEVYIHLLKEALKQNKQVLYLLPEIALTTQIINRLKNVFGNKVGVYHSKFSDAERVEIWNSILKNDENSYQIILGVRSSIFLPFNNLGLIIVDEEHENTYKQYNPAPRYNAKDTAIVLSNLHKAKVLLGTATPSIETYFNVKLKKFGLVELFERYQNIQLPEIVISDIRKAHKKKQMQSMFSKLLVENMTQVLENKEQIILFQNRRGFSPYVECDACNWIPKCVHCDVNLTYHKQNNQMVCHYCGYSHNVFHTCSACGSSALATKGFGTEKIEDEISMIFPEAKVARMDLDSTRSKKSFEKLISDFENNRTNILIGTQMITKGLDFDNVSLVGILNADNMLNFPDFRAYERSYQLMTQVSGRAGRKNKKGKVIIQTSNPEHTVIKDVITSDFEHLFITQINERKQFKYPPFVRLISINVKHRDLYALNKASDKLAFELRKIFDKNIQGPFFPAINRIQNFYIKNILIKLPKNQHLQANKQQILETIASIKEYDSFKQLEVVIDVDPM